MKVIHLWQDYSPNLFDRAHPLCLEHGIDSEVVCQAFIENGAKKLPNTYSVRTRTPEESNSQQFFSRVRRFVRRKVDTRRFAKLATEHTLQGKPDIAHCHFGTTAAVLAQHGALPHIPFLVSFYGVDISQSLNNLAVLNAYKEVIRKACMMHVLCDEAEQRLLVLGCPREKIRNANLPIDLSAIPDIGVEALGTTRFLIPARFVEKKGHLVLLKAYRRLVDAGYPVALTCFGYGPVEWLLRAIDDLALKDHVKVIDNRQTGDFMTEYVRQLRVHDVVLAPSVRAANGDDEGGPALTLVMAQAAGKPVIASDFPGAERSIADGVEGLIVKAGDEQALYDALASVINDSSAWNVFGNAGQTRTRKEFSDATYWEELSQWYSMMMSAEKVLS
jgi:glycosyltransferase involved in cell wall biosynthesis